jgi:hypothetical protein
MSSTTATTFTTTFGPATRNGNNQTILHEDGFAAISHLDHGVPCTTIEARRSDDGPIGSDAKPRLLC